ncbi:putative DNA helicase ino80 [Nowakowskiella sp. JEL0078]|nr:putative DNA helicase ino80 [Nowakowskiella sp. JEL0078]
MPTFFDSHEEFSKWFSNDIESHAENRGDLNQHQLQRLHMILKPFMLRRIKKDVENELAEKIELQIKCYMSARQKRMTSALKSSISIDDLLQRAVSLNQNDEVNFLMNHVMQLRKVCNHPDLFERANVISPVVWFDTSKLDSTPISKKEKSSEFIYCSASNPIILRIPKFFYRQGLVNTKGINDGKKSFWLDTKSLVIHKYCLVSTSENVHRSKFYDGSDESKRYKL